MTAYYALPEQDLLAQCDWYASRASGPGGQKRNKTHSAIQLTHRPTGITVHANESRLQGENRTLAMQRLRLALATQVREAVDPETFTPPAELATQRDARGKVAVNPGNPRYLPIIAAILDLLQFYRGQVAPAASRLGLTTTNCINVLHADPKVWTATQTMRARFGLSMLKA